MLKVANPKKSSMWHQAMVALHVALFSFAAAVVAADPPTIQPFGRKDAAADAPPRDDAVQGYIKLSNGVIRPGWLYVTRDKRLKMYDEAVERQREIPWSAVERIECEIKREWMEKEWQFKETTSDVKLYTGRKYPSREYVHTVTLRNGKTITGPLAAIVYLQTSPDEEAESFLLNKRNKGEMGQKMSALIYVQEIKLGKKAFEEGMKKMRPKSKGNKTGRPGDEETGRLKDRSSESPNLPISQSPSLPVSKSPSPVAPGP
jgi:hypothetical protein